MTSPLPVEFKERYPFTCPCGKKLEAAPSLSMCMGINHGAAACPSCKTSLHLTLAPDMENATHMEAEPYAVFRQREYPEIPLEKEIWQ